MFRLKSVFAVMLIFVLSVFFAACAKEGQAPAAPAEAEDPNELLGKPFDASKDMALVCDGVSYPVGASQDALIDKLGADYEYTESVSCMREGMEKAYEYEGLRIETEPTSSGDRISLFVITGEGFTTPRGIGVGSTEKELFDAYPDHYFDEYYYIFSESNDPNDLRDKRIQVVLEDGAVKEINIYSPDFGR